MAEENMASPNMLVLWKDNDNAKSQSSSSSSEGKEVDAEVKEEEDLHEGLNFVEVEVNEEEMEALVGSQEIGSSSDNNPAKLAAKVVAIKVVETLLPYGIGAGALAATEGSAAAAEFAAAHLTALQASCGAVVAIVRVYFYVVGGAMTIGAVCGVGGGICYGIHQVLLDRRTGQPLQVDQEELQAASLQNVARSRGVKDLDEIVVSAMTDHEEAQALKAAHLLNVARCQETIDLNVTVSAMRDHLKHPSVQVAGCLDLLQSVGTIDNGTILASGLVEATITAMDCHWDEEEVLKKGSEALDALFGVCAEGDVTTLRELGADHAIEKAKESVGAL